MAINELLAAFEGEEDLPVDLNKVSKWLIDKGIQDEIEFIGVDLDVGIIRGFLHRFRYQRAAYGESVCAANVYYDRTQGEDWINIVCAKELIHLTNGKVAVTSKGDFDTLIKRLSLPNELKILLEDPAYALVDKFGDAFAAALLLPKAARDELKAPFLAGDITAGDIATFAVIPVHYVRMMMSDEWDAAYERMLKM